MVKSLNMKLFSDKYFCNTLLSRTSVLIVAVILLLSGCQEDWDKHYTPADQSVNELMWDRIQLNENYSLFVNYIEDNNLDTLLKSNQQYTLFIPDNNAFKNIPDTTEINSFLLNYLISPNVVSMRNVKTMKKLQTLSGKFALIEHYASEYYFDNAQITYQSPLFLDGRYYELIEFPFAEPNFKEYFSKNLPFLDNYISSQSYDSLDKKQSTPIGFDENGNTIYDSVFIRVNPFAESYFPIDEESRNNFATFILFDQDQYNAALDEMAGKIGGVYDSHDDIPLVWQESILFPIILDNGLFENALTFEQLADPNLLNIQGEKVVLDISQIDPQSRITCSNGYIYEFYDFQVPDSLYLGEVKIEGEDLVDSIGREKYAWKESVKLEGEIVEPIKTTSEQASGNETVVVNLGRSFSGNYSVEMAFQNIFPGRHRFEWRANYRPSGVYNIYINDELFRTIDTYNLRNPLISVTGEIFRPTSSGFNKIDFYVENLTEFGEVKVRFEFVESGIFSTDGFNMDYISLIPEPN